MVIKDVLGAQLSTVRAFTRTPEGVAETLKRVADIGYKAIQIESAMVGLADPKAVYRMVEDNGLTVASTHTDWERFLDEPDEVIEEHKMWHCVHPAIGYLPSRYHDLDGLKTFLDELGPVVERLAQEGMDFSYHNHNHELVRFGGKTWLDMLFEQVDPGLLKAELDTYWIQAGGGDPAEWIRRFPGRQPLLHLKDMAVTLDREQRFAEVGEGNLNWPAILQAASEVGVEWYLVEQDQCYDRDPFESLAISYRNLQAMGLS
jgi:sugar phosphate isomerase/epimerase